MSCDGNQELLALYFDDCLTADARAVCDRHLDACPVCRSRLAELRLIRRGLGMLTAPVVPADLASSINQRLLAEAGTRLRREQTTAGDVLREWLQPRVMQYTFSVLASVLLFGVVLHSFQPHVIALNEAARAIDGAGMTKGSTQVRTPAYDINQPISPESYSALRAPYSNESPSLNPSGALAMLAWPSEGHNHKHDDADDMVVVADVYSNGVASLTDVMQAPRDRRMLDDFQKALRQDAAFVPASLDRRPDTMRVVFSVQRVDVLEPNF